MMKENSLKCVRSVRVIRVENGFIVTEGIAPLGSLDIPLHVFNSFTDLVKDLAIIFEVTDGENIAKGG